MYHHVARSLPGTLLFRTWEEGLACWRLVVRSVPNLEAFVIMPNHIHLLHEKRVERRLSQALATYVRWRNRHRGASGPGIDRVPAADLVSGKDKVHRNVRYIHLNPCRSDIVADPLAWPLSTHRDLVGLTLQPAVTRHRFPDEIHRIISSDPHVNVEGTFLPFASRGTPSSAEIAAAVGAVTRTLPAELKRKTLVRRLYLEAARGLTLDSHATIAMEAGCTRFTVLRVASSVNASARLVERVAGDPRFAAMAPGDLVLSWPKWMWRLE
jgi:hypothetical protein